MVAREYRVPPSRFLGLPWPEWGETDRLLTLALDTCDRLTCPCGCGQSVADCMSAETEGRWQASAESCLARAALEEYQERHKDDLPAGALVGVRLLAKGEEVTDDLAFDPAKAAREHAEMRARFDLD